MGDMAAFGKYQNWGIHYHPCSLSVKCGHRNDDLVLDKHTVLGTKHMMQQDLLGSGIKQDHSR